MQLAIIDTGQVVKIDHYKTLFPEVSFPTTGPDAEFLQANSAFEVTVWKSYDSATQKLVSVDPYIEGHYVYTVQVVDKTQEELDADSAMQVAKDNARTVTMRQARLALLQQGLLDNVNAALTLLEGVEGEAARITWEYASEVQKGDALVQSLAVQLGWSNIDLDTLFDLASTL